MKKIQKIKPKSDITWPTAKYFTIRQLLKLNPEFIEITLRVRLTKAIEEMRMFAEIGYIPGGKGRPVKVFAATPITTDILDHAEQQGIQLVDSARKKFINVVSVTNASVPQSNSTPSICNQLH